MRAETLEMMLARVEELSVENVRMLAESNMLGASSDFTEEKVLLGMTEAVAFSKGDK